MAAVDGVLCPCWGGRRGPASKVCVDGMYTEVVAVLLPWITIWRPVVT